MTVTASTTRNDYTAGSAQNVYSYTFQLNEATDVNVYLDGVLQTLNTHYTVQNVGNSTGGTITFTLVDSENNPIYPTEGAVINILMAMDLDRDTAYQPSGAFLAADVNNDFDRLWLASNQQQTEINRTLRLQDTDITTANMELPQNSTRRNKLLGFNNDGNPVAVTNNQINWDVAYDNMIVSTSFTDGNYTLTQQDGGTFTNSFDGRYFQNTGGNIYGGIDVNGAITSTGNLNITGTITASGYNNTNWDSAYNKKITSVDYSVGTNTLTLEQQDGNSLTTTLPGMQNTALSYNGVVKAEAVATGIDVTGNVSLDDNDKVQFGASNDLQIYHDGNASIIQDVGVGDLVLLGTDFIIGNSTGTQTYIRATEDAEVQLTYNGAQKIRTVATGIDVTGTVITDGLLSEIAASGARAILATFKNSAVLAADAQATIELKNAGQSAFITGESVAANSGMDIVFSSNDSTNTETNKMRLAENGDISFYEDTGTTPKLFWDASTERLGIGTTSPAELLHIHENTTGVARMRLSNTEGYLEIGTNNQVMNLDSQTHTFRNEAGSTEYMRIDSSGNLLVGKTSEGSSTVGAQLNASGTLTATVDGARTAIFNRKTSDGEIAVFRKDGSTVGSIGTRGGDVYLETGNTGIRMFDASNAIIAVGTNGASRNGEVDLGVSNIRFRDLHLSRAGYIPDVRSTSNQYLTHNTGNFLAIRNSSGAERMRIDSSGNVGIGTTSPDSRIQVKSSGTNNQSLLKLDTDSGTRAFIGSDAQDDGYLYLYDSSDNLKTAFRTDGNDSYIAGGGNVGIGTDSPNRPLTVESSSVGLAEFESTDSTSKVYFKDSGTTNTYSVAVGSVGDAMAFYASSGGAERMRIDSSGNVGIGGAPAAVTHGPHLDLVGNRGTLTVGTGYFEDNGTTNFIGGARPLAFGAGGSGERMRIDSSGNVGIGTSSPSQALDVDGNITASGTITAPNVDISTTGTVTTNIATGDAASDAISTKTVNIGTGFAGFFGGLTTVNIGTQSTGNQNTVNIGSGVSTAEKEDTINLKGNVTVDGTLSGLSYNYVIPLFQGYTNLTTSATQIGPDVYLRNYNSKHYKRFVEVDAAIGYSGTTSTNDLNLRVIMVVPTSSGNAVDIGSVVSITTTAIYNRDIVIAGDVTHWFSDYSGAGANSNGATPFTGVVSAVYNPTTDQTTFNAGVYNATIPSVGDSIYVHPFDWESAGTEIYGQIKQFDVDAEASLSYQIYTKVYFGNIDQITTCRFKFYEAASSDVINIQRLQIYQTDESA
jgi:hypothetical protein